MTIMQGKEDVLLEVVSVISVEKLFISKGSVKEGHHRIHHRVVVLNNHRRYFEVLILKSITSAKIIKGLKSIFV